MPCEPEAVIGHTILWKVVGTHLLTAIAHLYLGPPRLAQFFLPASLSQVPQARLEHRKRLRFILKLRFLVLASDYQPRGQVCNAYRRIGRVDALPAVTSRTIDINAEIAIFYIDCNLIIGFWQHYHLGGRRVDTPIRLGHGHALHAMGSPLVFHTAVSALTPHDKRHVFDPALFGLVGIQHFNLPVPSIGVAAVHAEKLPGKERRLVAARAGLHRNNSVFLVHTIFGQQQHLHLVEQPFFLRLEALKLFESEFAHLRGIAFVHLLDLGHLLVVVDQFVVLLHNLFDFSMLASVAL